MIVELSDRYSTDELRAEAASAIADPHFVRGMKLLADVRASQIFPTTKELPTRISLLLTLRHELSQCGAFVVTHPAHDQVARLIASTLGRYGLNFRIFTDLQTAINWLRSVP